MLNSERRVRTDAELMISTSNLISAGVCFSSTATPINFLFSLFFPPPLLHLVLFGLCFLNLNAKDAAEAGLLSLWEKPQSTSAADPDRLCTWIQTDSVLVRFAKAAFLMQADAESTNQRVHCLLPLWHQPLNITDNPKDHLLKGVDHGYISTNGCLFPCR
jgi:hypothetical protein